MDETTEYEIWQDDVCVQFVSNKSDSDHYALVHAQWGSVQVYEVVKTRTLLYTLADGRPTDERS